MAAEANMTIGAEVIGLGNEIDKRVRFATENAPEAVSAGYGTIAAALTYEALPLGQIAASLVDMVYLRSVDNTIYTYTASVAPAGNYAQQRINVGEACLFHPAVSLGVAISVMLMSDAAGAQYEYLIVGQSS